MPNNRKPSLRKRMEQLNVSVLDEAPQREELSPDQLWSKQERQGEVMAKKESVREAQTNQLVVKKALKQQTKGTMRNTFNTKDDSADKRQHAL
jgi:hypothetical protein